MREPVGLVLAGGRGTRMGGHAKADLMLGGTRLIDLVIDRLDPQVSAIAVNSNTPVVTPFPVLADTLPGDIGPLAGVLTGLDWAQAQGATHVVTVAVDTPFFPCDLVPRLLLAGAGGLAVATTPDCTHATFGLWPVTLRDALATYLDDGGRKLHAFTDAQNAMPARFPDTTPPSFFGIKTPHDLMSAARWI